MPHTGNASIILLVAQSSFLQTGWHNILSTLRVLCVLCGLFIMQPRSAQRIHGRLTHRYNSPIILCVLSDLCGFIRLFNRRARRDSIKVFTPVSSTIPLCALDVLSGFICSVCFV